jgi:two-component system NarL family response regulator
MHGHEPAQGGGTTARLGPRECAVLKLITEGEPSRAIATKLTISVSTVEAHRRNIMRKLGLHSIAALTRYAIREGLTPL